MKKLYGYYGGSRAYGLPLNKWSDWDYYSIGTSTQIQKPQIYPLIKLHQKKRTTGLDVEKVELCAYLTYLMNGFVFQVESLFVHQSWMDYRDPMFEDLVLNKRHLLIDRSRMVDNLCENIYSVREKKFKDIEALRDRNLKGRPPLKIVNGLNKMYDEYKIKGYYHKDYIHNIRLAASVLYFLKNDIYPVRLGEFDPEAFATISEIKERPHDFERKDLDAKLDRYLHAIETHSLDDDEDKFRFDSIHALKILKEFYA